MSYQSLGNDLILPQIRGFYQSLAEPVAFFGLRLGVGILSVVEGWPKINHPTGMEGFVESLGFYPGWFWSLALAVLQFGGGLLLILGLFTRPVAFATGVMLAFTLWFHITTPYGDALLSPEGIAAIRAAPELLTEASRAALLNLPADGGESFLHQIQFKANGLSFLWTLAAFFFAAFGAGRFSLDRLLGKEF